MSEIIRDHELGQLKHDRGYWAIIDKTLMDLPIQEQSETKTLVQITVDWVRVGDDLKPQTWWYPDDAFDMKFALSQFNSFINRKLRARERFEKDKVMYEGNPHT